MSKLELLDFIATEATHDSFYNMTDLLDKRKGNYDLRELVDELGKYCVLKNTTQKNITPNVPYKSIPLSNTPSKVFKNSYFAKNKGITEFEMDEVLLGEKRHLLCLNNKNAWKQKNIRSLEYNTMKVSDKGARIRHFSEIACNRNDTKLVNDMFSHVKSRNTRDIYFVCDSASELIGKFSITPYFPTDINVHMMISSSTLADPSSRISRFTSKHANVAQKKGNKYIHTYQVPISLKKCDKFGLLDFSITHRLIAKSQQHPTDYEVSEDFVYSKTGKTGRKDPIPQSITLSPAHKTTAKKKIQCLISGSSICNINSAKPAKSPFYMDKRRGLRIAQYKRMGDHQQIRFVRWLWDKKNFNSSQELYHVNTNTTLTNLTSFNRPSPNNCFFVTGDWPAFEYAIFHRINAIIKTSASNGSPRGILMVTFH